MARSQWDRAETFAGQARDVLRAAGVEESFATPLVCACQAAAAADKISRSRIRTSVSP
jgi:hypothetical protein